ncbi:sulfatase-like hydrolase/transferase [Pseudohalioglobus sediminis]|uniref:Sulfatase-like hydrolase/transferase n=1 Tax=Pseudohalioglobus sediminis TaxID=2606449 RepID=A0A5B0WTM9_9GAMM|nr:sulfatase-like hydrolase/transferase [Pseudohalioglobus sediminis]KAA1189541.1 sulfatase-like hydrolase/transferase [Pseudohalioglobus sediminis]
MKKQTLDGRCRALGSLIGLVVGVAMIAPTMAAKPIIHDGEYYFLQSQYEDEWAREDAEIDQKLADIRKANGDKRPNIVFVLIDDVSFGQMGKPALNDVMGVQTPRINQFASQGMSLNRMYTEPSCTPTRAATLTGRHPVRTGIKEVKVALVGEGLGASEVTIAEVLSKAGYNTAHIGKWHQGDIEQAYPHNQGFDFAAFPLHQQVQLALMSPESARANNLLGWYEGTQNNSLAVDKKFKPNGLVTGVEARKGGKAREVDLKPGETWTQAHYERMNERYQRQTIEQLRDMAGKDEPFFLQYWPLYPLNFVHPEQARSLNGGFMADKLEVIDEWFGDILDEMDKLGVSENTLVVFMADNGLMYHYEGTSGMSQLVYRGGKTDFTEGGIRVDAYARWPGAIEAGSRAADIVHASDLFTTFARVAQAEKHVPRDRVIDGIDQTPVLFKGNGHGRRDYVYVYQNELLRAVVKQEWKMHLPAPGMPAAAAGVYNVYRDPREEHPLIGHSLWSGASFQDMAKRHMMTIKKYPHNKLGKDRPYTGIENLRPESVETVERFMSWH